MQTPMSPRSGVRNHQNSIPPGASHNVNLLYKTRPVTTIPIEVTAIARWRLKKAWMPKKERIKGGEKTKMLLPRLIRLAGKLSLRSARNDPRF